MARRISSVKHKLLNPVSEDYKKQLPEYTKDNEYIPATILDKDIANIGTNELNRDKRFYSNALFEAIDSAMLAGKTSTSGYFGLLSREQAKLFKRYSEQADNLTDEDLIDLDNFLGSFYITKDEQ